MISRLQTTRAPRFALSLVRQHTRALALPPALASSVDPPSAPAPSDPTQDVDPSETTEDESAIEGDAGPSMLAGMRVAINVHAGRLCVLGACETPWGTIPIACHFGIEGEPEEDRPVSLADPQTPGVLAALAQAEERLDVLAKRESDDLAVENVVRRARLGDQVATATIAEMRRFAPRGGRAAFMLKKVTAYVQAHPYQASEIGLEPAPIARVSNASTALANGPLLSKSRLLQIAASLGENARAFVFGCVHFRRPREIESAISEHPEAESAIRTGAAAGLARAIQMVRLPDSSIAAFCPHVAWELGE